MQLDAQCHLLKCAITWHLCQKGRYHKPILLVFDHQNVLVDLERTTAVSLLGKTVLVDQTIPSYCPFVTTDTRVPALLLDQANRNNSQALKML